MPRTQSIATLAAAIALAVLSALPFLGSGPPGAAAQTFRPATQEPLDLTPDERVNIDVYERCNRGVVNITTKVITEDLLGLYGYVAEGSGSGIVIDKKGHILTNFHVLADVLEGRGGLVVTIYDGTNFQAKLVGVDESNDVAVIRIDAPSEKLFPVELGESSNLRVGLRVFAIGNPFGLDRTMTQGIISSLDRVVQSRRGRPIKGLIQTDAAINPGNSGGPLLDKHGRMIGMNTAIKAQVEQSSGIAFSIPVNTIKRLLPQILQYGRVIRAEIGIEVVSKVEGGGLLIVKLSKGGSAELAGLRGPAVRRRGPFAYIDYRRADIIIQVDGQRIRTSDDLLEYVESKRPGDSVVVTVLRDGQRVDVSVKLQSSGNGER